MTLFHKAAQETWKGPAAFLIGRRPARPSTGSPEVVVLPGAVPVKMAG
jgi:hypothetical protein